MSGGRVPMSKETVKKLEEQLHDLKIVKRPQKMKIGSVIPKIEFSIKFGSKAKNAAASNENSFFRIVLLKQ